MLTILKKIFKKFNQSQRDDLFIAEATMEEQLLIKKCLAYSMTTKIRMWTLINSINYVAKKGIKGDFVECGVWKGGNLMVFEILNKKLNLKKKVFGFDTYEGMPTPSIHDIKFSGWSAIENYDKRLKSENGYCLATLDEVKKNINFEVPYNNINLIKGKVENTLHLNKNLPDDISILRLDTDFYESTLVELEVLYPKLANGGILIIDDYGSYQGAKKAVDEYFKHRPFLIYIDHSCRMIIKD